MVLVRQPAAGHGFEHGDALAEVSPGCIPALFALVDKELGYAQQLDGHTPHQVRQRVLQPEDPTQHLQRDVPRSRILDASFLFS